MKTYYNSCKQQAISKKLGLASITMATSIIICSSLYSSSTLADTSKFVVKPSYNNNFEFQSHQVKHKKNKKRNKYVSDDSDSSDSASSDSMSDQVDCVGESVQSSQGLRAALANASDGTVICLEENIYIPSNTNNRDETFLINVNNITLQGVGNASNVILSGEIQSDSDNSNNSQSVLSIINSQGIHLKNLTITEGTNDRIVNPSVVIFGAPAGAGLYAEMSEVLLDNVIVSNNRTLGGSVDFGVGVGMGAGIGALDSYIQVLNSKIVNNIATRDGGGFALLGGTLKLKKSIVANNQSDRFFSSGTVFQGDLLEIKDSTIKNNIATGSDPFCQIFCVVGIASFSTKMTIVDKSRFFNNQALNGVMSSSSLDVVGEPFSVQVSGKAIIKNTIFQDNLTTTGGGTVELTLLESAVVNNSIFKDNRLVGTETGSEFGGAAMNIEENRNVTIKNSKFIGNSSSLVGGALMINRCEEPLKILNNEFESNSAILEGGAVWNDCELILRKNEFENNSATLGGALFQDNVTFSSGSTNNILKLISNEFEDNSASSGNHIYCTSSTISIEKERNNEYEDPEEGPINCFISDD